MKKIYYNPEDENLIIYDEGKITELKPVVTELTEEQMVEVVNRTGRPFVPKKPKAKKKQGKRLRRTSDEIEAIIISMKEEGIKAASKKFGLADNSLHALRKRYLDNHPEKREKLEGPGSGRRSKKTEEPAEIKPPKEITSGGNQPRSYVCLDCTNEFLSRLDPLKDDISELRCPNCKGKNLDLKL